MAVRNIDLVRRERTSGEKFSENPKIGDTIGNPSFRSESGSSVELAAMPLPVIDRERGDLMTFIEQMPEKNG